MSTAGLPDLLNDLLQCTGISDALQGKIKEKTEGLAKKSKNNSEETQGSSDNAGNSSGGKDGGGKKEKNKDFKKPTEAMGLKDEQGFLKADYGEHCLYFDASWNKSRSVSYALTEPCAIGGKGKV